MSSRDFLAAVILLFSAAAIFICSFWLSLGSQAAIPGILSGYFFCTYALIGSSRYPPVAISCALLSGYSCDLLYCVWLSFNPQVPFLWSLVLLLAILQSSGAIPVISCIAFGYHCILSGYSCDLLYCFWLSLHPQRLFLWSLVLLLAILASSASIPVISFLAFLVISCGLLSGYSCDLLYIAFGYSCILSAFSCVHVSVLFLFRK